MSRSKNPFPQHFEGVMYPNRPYFSDLYDFSYERGWYQIRNIKNGYYITSRRWYTIQQWISSGQLQIVSYDGATDLSDEIDLSDMI